MMESFLQLPDPALDDDMPAYMIRLSDGHRMTSQDYVKLTDHLADSLLDSDTNHHLCIDWSQCPTHPLIFIIDVINPRGTPTYHTLVDYFHTIFLPVLEKYIRLDILTVILSMRRHDGGGMLVHVLNVQLSHDDYVSLCHRMEDACVCTSLQNAEGTCYLSCPSIMYLVASDEMGEDDPRGLFVPAQMLHIQFPKQVLPKHPPEVASILLIHKPLNDPNLFYRVKYAHYRHLLKTVMCLTMPVPQVCSPLAEEPILVLEFATRIVPKDARSMEDVKEEDVEAHFKSCLNGRDYLLVKDTILSTGLPGVSFGYQFLKNHSRFISLLRSRNKALNTWYNRSFTKIPPREDGCYYNRIEQSLLQQCPHLESVSHPLRKLLESRHLQIPSYYALHHLLQKKGHPFEKSTVTLFKPACVHLPPPKKSNGLSFQTLLYCAFKVTLHQTKEDMFIFHMGVGWDWILSSITNLSQMTQVVRDIQEKFFPLVKGSLGDEEKFYTWDPVMNRWDEVTEKKLIKTVIEFISHILRYFEGFSKVPKEIKTALEDQTEWIDCLVEDLWTGIEMAEPIPFSYQELSDEDHEKMYGLNVPEYYFVKKTDNK